MKFKKALVPALISIALLSGCGGDSNNDDTTFSLSLSDAPVDDLAQVVICFNQVELKGGQNTTVFTVGEDAGVLPADNVCGETENTVGIDIIESAVNSLRKRGHDVRLCDATSDVDLEERFERVVIGDVIEHVDNPVALLRFAARHLEDGGSIMCTTPNPFYIGNILQTIRDGTYIANAEHITWITPSMGLELAYRSGLSLHSYWHASGEGHTFFRKILISFLKMTNLVKSELFARSFVYIFEKPVEI